MIHNQTVAEVATDIETAADVIRMYGLNKGDFWPGAGQSGAYVPGLPVCAYGALAVARGTEPDSQRQGCPAMAVLEVELGGEMVEWNDDPHTTADMVVEKFLDVAKKLRNGEIEL